MAWDRHGNYSRSVPRRREGPQGLPGPGRGRPARGPARRAAAVRAPGPVAGLACRGGPACGRRGPPPGAGRAGRPDDAGDVVGGGLSPARPGRMEEATDERQRHEGRDGVGRGGGPARWHRACPRRGGDPGDRPTPVEGPGGEDRPLTEGELRELLGRAGRGDLTVLPALRRLLDAAPAPLAVRRRRRPARRGRLDRPARRPGPARAGVR